MTSEYEFRDGISTSSRFVKAGGYMLKVPAIDIAEVGAGGGSIAGIDKGGLLMVGPQSAGAVPGPACYGLRQRAADGDRRQRGARLHQPALRLPAAGSPIDAVAERAGDRDACRRAARALDCEDAAHGIRAVANANMARAIRAVTVERGRDPRDLTLIAFGGNGGVHALDVARAARHPPRRGAAAVRRVQRGRHAGRRCRAHRARHRARAASTG